MAANTRIKYTKDQLEEYFNRICLPAAKRVYDVSTLPETDKLTYLTLLQKHQLTKIPWENLTQHYSWHRVVNVRPQHLFRKIVHQPGRGGYCMEANYFFHLILYCLGFNVIMAGSRIHSPPDHYGGWTHVVNLVRIGSVRYVLDGGFGPQGPIRPLPLEHGVVSAQIAPAECRVVHEAIPEFLDQEQRVWIYQWRKDPMSDFSPMYCFTDFEFTPRDIESMNFAPWLNRQSFFTHEVVACRFTTCKEEKDGPGSPGEATLESEIDGAITVNQDVLKWRRSGEKVVELKFKTEQERVEALEKYFGIVLAEEDREAVAGTASAIG